MKKILFLLILCLLPGVAAWAQSVSLTYPDDFADGWSQYVGQTVTFENRFYLGGFTSADGYYTGDALLTAMRRTPSDVATPGTPAYTEAEAVSDALWDSRVQLTFGDGHLNYYLLTRVGSYVDGLTATVKGERHIEVARTDDVPWQQNRPTARPDLGDADLVVCASNLAAFSPFLDAFKSDNAPDTREEADLKTAKVVAALQTMDADIYAFCELQDTNTVVNFLADRLNEACGQPGRYAGLDDGVKPMQIGAGRTGYVYRTDRVRPVGTLGRPDASNPVYGRHQYVQQFEQTDNGARFALSINHFKAKTANSDPQRVENMQNLINYLRSAPSLDDDVLVMGDLNTYTHETPLVMLADEGYTDLLATYNPEGFSYVYQNEVGNMDHAWASASLAPQVTGAAVFQINAEESHHYKLGGDVVTDDMYGYSDHNPVLVGLRLAPEAEQACEDIDFAESFASSLGAFTPVNVAGGNDWYCDTKWHYAVMNGHSQGGDNEDWLVSPAFDLRGKGTPTLAFAHAINYADKSRLEQEHTLWVTDAYTGDPTTTQWTQVDIPDYPTGSNWTFVNTSLDLPAAFAGKENVQFAFKYLCEDGAASAWEIKNLTFQAACGGDSGLEAPAPQPICYTRGRTVHLEGLPAGAEVRLHDLLGRPLATLHADGTHAAWTAPAPGVYLLTAAGRTYRVAVE